MIQNLTLFSRFKLFLRLLGQRSWEGSCDTQQQLTSLPVVPLLTKVKQIKCDSFQVTQTWTSYDAGYLYSSIFSASDLSHTAQHSQAPTCTISTLLPPNLLHRHFLSQPYECFIYPLRFLSPNFCRSVAFLKPRKKAYLQARCCHGDIPPSSHRLVPQLAHSLE